MTAQIFNNDAGDVLKSIYFDNFKISFDSLYSQRIVTSTADGIHSFGNYVPVVIANSSFEGMADDAVALHVRGGLVASMTSQNELTLSNVNTAWFRAGDVLNVIDMLSATLRCQATILSAVPSPGAANWLLMLDRSCPGIKAGTADADKAYNETMAKQMNIVSGNQFRKFRGGMRILVSTTISNNDFREGGIYKIIIGADFSSPSYTSVSLPHDISIVNNRFHGVSKAIDPMPEFGSEISTFLYGTGGSAGSGSGISNIHIEGNYFRDLQDVMGVIRNCKNCTLVGNTVDNKMSNRVRDGYILNILKSSNVNVGTMWRPFTINDENAGPALTTCGVKMSATCINCFSDFIRGDIASGAPLKCQ